jgi:HK97 gp10 family phage protein
MADPVTFNLHGIEDVLARLQRLPMRMQKRSVRRAARKAMSIVRTDARANAKRIDDKESAEKIWKNITLRESGKAGKKVGGIVMKVGVKGGAAVNQHSADVSSLSGGDTRHWRFIELGSENNSATPFMRPALANNIGVVTSTFIDVLKKEIDDAL